MGFFGNLASSLNKGVENALYKKYQSSSTSELKNKLYQYELWKRNQGGQCLTNEDVNVIKKILNERGAN